MLIFEISFQSVWKKEPAYRSQLNQMSASFKPKKQLTWSGRGPAGAAASDQVQTSTGAARFNFVKRPRLSGILGLYAEENRPATSPRVEAERPGSHCRAEQIESPRSAMALEYSHLPVNISCPVEANRRGLVGQQEAAGGHTETETAVAWAGPQLSTSQVGTVPYVCHRIPFFAKTGAGDKGTK